MKKAISILISICLLLSLCPAALMEGADAYQGDIVLFLTNDMHSNLGSSKIMNDDGSTTVIGGMARLAAAMTAERAKAEGKSLTLDGGDYSQGTPYQDGYQAGWEVLAMATLGTQFTTLGNHEFDVGDQAIENSYVNARANAQKFGVDGQIPQLIVSNMFIKYDDKGEVIAYTNDDIKPDDLSTNAFASGEYAETGAKNYVVTEVNGYKIGMFGIVGENAYGYCKNSDLTRMDASAVANVYAKFLKEEKKCDLVIAISHCGDGEDKVTAQNSEGYLDMIQSAHSHTPYDAPVVENGVIIFSTGSNAQNLGVISLKKAKTGWTFIPEESRTRLLTDAFDKAADDTSAPAEAFRKMSKLIAQYGQELQAPGGYFDKLGLTGAGPDTVVMKIGTGANYVPKIDGKSYGYTFEQSPVTAFIGDGFNYASGSDVSFFFGGYVRTSLYQGDFTVADAFNIQSTGESAVDRSAGASLIVAPLSGKQLIGICVFDAMCSGAAGDITYGGAGTLHSSGMRYNYTITDGKKINCDTSSIEIFLNGKWEPVNPDKAYLCSFTFESTQNLVGFMPMLTGGIPFSPYDEATGTYAEIPADNTSDEYYAFWAPYCVGKGVLEGTELELKAWSALYYYAKHLSETTGFDALYTPDKIVPTRTRIK